MSARQEVDLSALRLLRRIYVFSFFHRHLLLECHLITSGRSMGFRKIVFSDFVIFFAPWIVDLPCIYKQIFSPPVAYENLCLDCPWIPFDVADSHRLLRAGVVCRMAFFGNSLDDFRFFAPSFYSGVGHLFH